MKALTGSVITMSSLDIAHICKKRHDHVLRDIEKQLSEAGISLPNSGEYRNERGKTCKCYNLPKRECLLIVAGYDAKIRLLIIDRWMELESTARQSPLSREQQLLADTVALLSEKAASLLLAAIAPANEYLSQTEDGRLRTGIRRASFVAGPSRADDAAALAQARRKVNAALDALTGQLCFPL